MWFLYLIIGVVAVVLWVIWTSEALCPRCGIELPREFGTPWKHVDYCRCGWREGQRP